MEGLNMIKCNNCGHELPDEAIFCMKCGAKLEKKLFCSSCNKELPKDATFCMYCGKKVQDQEKNEMLFEKEDSNESFGEIEADSDSNDKSHEKYSEIQLMKNLVKKYYDIKRVSSDGSCWIVESKEGVTHSGGGLKVIDENKLLEKYENTISKSSLDENGEYYSKNTVEVKLPSGKSRTHVVEHNEEKLMSFSAELEGNWIWYSDDTVVNLSQLNYLGEGTIRIAEIIENDGRFEFNVKELEGEIIHECGDEATVIWGSKYEIEEYIYKCVVVYQKYEKKVVAVLSGKLCEAYNGYSRDYPFLILQDKNKLFDSKFGKTEEKAIIHLSNGILYPFGTKLAYSVFEKNDRGDKYYYILAALHDNIPQSTGKKVKLYKVLEIMNGNITSVDVEKFLSKKNRLTQILGANFYI